MKRKTSFLLVIVCAVVPHVFSESLEDLVGADYAARLRSNASITEAQLRNPSPRLLPMYGELRQFVTTAMNTLDPSLLIETLHLYRKPVASGSWNDAQRAGLFNSLLSLSTLTGIQYYSASRRTMRTFYESSVVIDGPDTKNTLPDPVYAYPPASLTIYARQKDLTFGDNIYRYDFVAAANAIFFSQENMTALKYGIITAVARNRLRSIIAVIDCGDSLLIYAVSIAKAVSLPGMSDRIVSSFENRTEAVLNWFTGKADAVFSFE